MTRPSHQLIHSSNSVEWFTPAMYVEAARKVLGGIDLDPASCARANRVVRAKKFFTASHNGLARDWFGRVFLNPPYGRDAAHRSNQDVWSRYLLDQHAKGNVTAAVLLVNAHVDCSWFQRLWDFPICFVDRRIKFTSANPNKKRSPTHGNAFVYLGRRAWRFVDVFSRFGRIVMSFNGRLGLVVTPRDRQGWPLGQAQGKA